MSKKNSNFAAKFGVGKMSIEINQQRIDYLLSMYKMTRDELLAQLNENRSRVYSLSDISGNQISFSLLKNIDKIFQVGIEYYLDFSAITPKKSNSIFFRKTNFGSNLNMEAKRRVQSFEMLKAELDAYWKLSEISIPKPSIHLTINDDPYQAAQKIRETFYPQNVAKKDRDFLKELINKLAEQYIYVFEFVETWNKKELANIDGLFIGPNMIVLKRQKSYKREIFTLAHELGHYVLQEEEIEAIDLPSMASGGDMSAVEKWCNDFAFYFLMGEELSEFNDIEKADDTNDYEMDTIERISSATHVSRLALFTRLAMAHKMSNLHYQYVRADLDAQYQRMVNDAIEQIEKKGGASPKPIISDFYRDTLCCALYNGIINEAKFCKELRVKPTEIYKYYE